MPRINLVGFRVQWANSRLKTVEMSIDLLGVGNGMPYRVARWRGLPSTQLSGERCCFVREAFGEHQILRSNRLVSLTNETLGRVVLRPCVGVQYAVVDPPEVGIRARERCANA